MNFYNEKNICRFFFAIIFLLFIIGCKKRLKLSIPHLMSDYYPFKVGKTYFYRLDSTVPASFGTSLISKKLSGKRHGGINLSDNQGRLSFRIFRFTRDTAGIQPWRFISTHLWQQPLLNGWNMWIIISGLLKLHAPLTEGYSWKAHSFIDTKSLNTTVSYLDEWEYAYARMLEKITRFFNKL